MSKTSKILILLISIAFLLIFYLVMSSQIITMKPEETAQTPVKKEPVAMQKAEKIDLQKLEENYKDRVNTGSNWSPAKTPASTSRPSTSTDSGIETIGGDEAAAIVSEAKEDQVLEKISELKIGLMELTVPEELRDLHLGLVLSFSEIKNSIENNSEKDKEDGLALIKQIKAEYKWIIE